MCPRNSLQLAFKYFGRHVDSLPVVLVVLEYIYVIVFEHIFDLLVHKCIWPEHYTEVFVLRLL